MRTKALMTAKAPDEAGMLKLARDWKDGRLRPVHPSVGQMLNRALVGAHEECVPFRRATSLTSPSIADLIRTEHERASGVRVPRVRVA